MLRPSGDHSGFVKSSIAASQVCVAMTYQRQRVNRSVRLEDPSSIAGPTTPTGNHGAHSWWYRCVERAGVVAKGVTAGEKMHKARHTAGQRVLDKTGNLKATQKLLGHESIQTTGDIYTDWDIDQLAETLAEVV